MNATERRAKIVCTLGPASSDPEIVLRLVEAGLDVARINFSHGDPASWSRAIGSVRAAQEGTGKPLSILGDLQGPKIRIGGVPDACILARRDAVVIVAHDPGRMIAPSLDDGVLTIGCPYAALVDEVEVGGRIYLRDGEIDLRVERIDGGRIETMVRGGGRLTSRAGLHAAGAGSALPALTDADRDNVRFAVEQGLDYLALSFVRSADDVMAAHEASAQAGGELPLIAKIETAPAMASLEAIIPAAGGAMVARGDLGVELGAAEVPVAQRRIIAAAGRALAPVIIATQMLESMVERTRPTRAEASDVANAVWDGADALMLSAETAVGLHPVEVVEMMDMIIRRAEANDPGRSAIIDPGAAEGNIARTISWAVAAAVERHPGVKAVVAFTVTGTSGRLISKDRLPVPTLVMAPSAEIQQRLALSWGVRPWRCDPPDNTVAMLADVESAAMEALGLSEGDEVVVTGGIPLGEGQPTNFLKLHRIGDRR